MESEGSGGPSQWTPTMSSFMLHFLADVVAGGTRTSSGFKKVHLNACAKALNEYFKVNKTGDQVSNHLRTWRRKYTKINQLRKVSAAIWDEDNYIISLDHEHYTSYIKDHKSDDEFLNKPLEYYRLLVTIFGNSVTTGKFAKGSSDPLGVEEKDENDGQDETTTDRAATDDNGATSSASRPTKRAKTNDTSDDGLIGAIKEASTNLSKAIEKAALADKMLPPDLLDNVRSIPGFDDMQKFLYYAHLVKNPDIGRAFNELPLDYKLNWMTKFVTDNM